MQPHEKMESNFKDSHGFTTLEIIVVLVVMGIFAAVVEALQKRATRKRESIDAQLRQRRNERVSKG